VPLRVLVDEALQALSQTIEDSGAAMTVEIEDAIVRADRVHGTRVVQKLVSNALKFHKPRQRPAVRIRTERIDRSRRRLVVEDEGVGFDPAFSEEIFRPFRRLHRHEGFTGSGMGLAICNAIAGRLGWTLSASSRVGEGSRFEIAFPVDGDATPAGSTPGRRADGAAARTELHPK
jgi:light-regulated signal transduction histidine kinase (bacteriophytochrome)